MYSFLQMPGKRISACQCNFAQVQVKASILFWKCTSKYIMGLGSDPKFIEVSYFLSTHIYSV